MRIGIATGLVVVGDLIGEGPSREFALIGEAPNLAARLQQIAKPNQILVAPTTRRLLGQLFEFTDLGEQEIKGHSERVRVSAVLRNSGASRFEARQSVRRAPLIGRDLELTLVRPAIQYWLKAGQQTSKRSAFMEAITHFQSALKLLEELPEDKERFELEIQIQQSFAAASMAAKGFGAEATVHALNRALKLCHRLNAPQQIFPVLSGLIGAHLMRGKIESARELAQDLLNLAQNRNDRTALLMGHRYSRSANSPRRSANYKTQ